jgi:DNA-binding LytR/AlgR family response regulator
MSQIYPTKRITFESAEEVILFEADINYTIIHLIDGSKIISGYTLKFVAERLSEQPFIRINKSYLINVTYISDFTLSKEGAYVKLFDGREMQVSRRRIKNLQQLNLSVAA